MGTTGNSLSGRNAGEGLMGSRGLIGIGVAMLAAIVGAQTPVGWQEGSPLNAYFDPDRVYVFTARVIGVEVSVPRPKVSAGVTLLVRLGDGKSAVVDLGPQTYLEERGIRPRIGEIFEFAGSCVFENGSYGYVASRMARGNLRVTLRTPVGKPLGVSSSD